jgi:hypothetical protein
MILFQLPLLPLFLLLLVIPFRPLHSMGCTQCLDKKNPASQQQAGLSSAVAAARDGRLANSHSQYTAPGLRHARGEP